MTELTPNTELFQKIREQITVHPETLNMSAWENFCGTTRCVAGWAVHLETGDRVFAQGYQVFAQGYRAMIESPSVVRLAEEFGLSVASVAGVAARLLGLTRREAGGLFYGTNEAATAIVEAFADGDNDRARQLIDVEYESIDDDRDMDEGY